jgi:hypothetical protein
METVEVVISGIRPDQIAPSLASCAYKLALNVRPIFPGVFSVGDCVVDRWRASCSCKASRTQKQIHHKIVKPCVHFQAVLLAEGIEAWHPITGEFIQVPTIKKWDCRLSGVPGVWEFVEGWDDGWLCFLSKDGAQTTIATIADVTHFHPIYEVTS